jgi:hypothetical protein
VIGRAVRGVDDDLQALQRQLVAEGALAELDVAAAGVVEPARLAELGRAGPARLALERRLDPALPVVGKLLAARREELDAVVGKALCEALMTSPRLRRSARVR